MEHDFEGRFGDVDIFNGHACQASIRRGGVSKIVHRMLLHLNLAILGCRELEHIAFHSRHLTRVGLVRLGTLPRGKRFPLETFGKIVLSS